MPKNTVNTILEIDAGNTRVKWRLLKRQADHLAQVSTNATMHHLQLQDNGYLFTKSLLTETNNAFMGTRQSQFGMPTKRGVFEQLIETADHVRVVTVAGDRIKRYFYDRTKDTSQLFFAETSAQCAGVSNGYAQGLSLGVDRWLAMLAAFNYNKTPEDVSAEQHACCVIDCGSAVTVDLIDMHGQHQGGYIVPGLSLLEMSLLKNTAEIKLANQSNSSIDDISWADSTELAIMRGNLSMLSAWLNHLIAQIKYANTRIFITGGDAEILAPYLTAATIYVPDLVLDGLFWCDH